MFLMPCCLPWRPQNKKHGCAVHAVCADLLKTSAAMGTVELTGLDMMATQAPGQYLATPAHRFATIPAPCRAQLGSARAAGAPDACQLPECCAALSR